MSKTECVRITKHGNMYYEGKVISKHNYGTKDNPDWYIEFTDTYQGYIYFKQCFTNNFTIEFFTEE